MLQQRSLDGEQVSDWMMGVNRLYPGTIPALPKPPAGYKAVYLTHYGRHGSRYLASAGQYSSVYSIFASAGESGVLTALGEDVFERYSAVYPVFLQKVGELTSTGAVQHRCIAWRMVRNYPGLFKGPARVVANSTNYERTMLSMQNFTQTLVSLCPSLDLQADASRAYMGTINQHSPENPRVTDEDVRWKSSDAPWRPAFWDYFRARIDWEPVCSRLFTDLNWLLGVCDPFEFMVNLYSIALVVPGCPEECKGFFDVFTSAELAELAGMNNYAFYVEKSRTPVGNRRGCFLSEALLGDILDKVRQDMESGVSVRLRFGHDGCMMALFSMLKLDGWDAEVSDQKLFAESYDVSRIPMAANLQIVLFGKGGHRSSDDLVFLMLLNEEALELPLEDLGGHYYRWQDFLDYCDPILAEAREALDNS